MSSPDYKAIDLTPSLSTSQPEPENGSHQSIYFQKPADSFFSELIKVMFNREVLVILLLGPIFLTLLFGGAYANNYVDSIPTAILDDDNSATSRSIAQQFEENSRFHVVCHAASRQELQEMISSRKAALGIYIPPRFGSDVATMQGSSIMAVVDGTNVITGNNAYAAAAGIVQTIAAGTQIKILEAKGLTSQNAESMALVFNFNDRTLYDPRMTYMNYLLLGYIAVFLQQVMLSGLGNSLLSDAGTIASGHTLPRIMLRIAVCAMYALAAIRISIQIAIKIFHVPVAGNIHQALLMGLIFALAISGPAILLASLVKDKIRYTQIALMLSLPTFVSSGYVWPQNQMPQWLVGIVKVFWPLIHFARPFDELLLKGTPPASLPGSIASLLLYTVFWLPLCIYIFKRRFSSSH